MASLSSYDLVVYDDSIKSVSDKIKKYGDNLNEYINEYIAILDRVSAEGVKSGCVHDNLIAFKEAVKGLNNQVNVIAEKYNECATGFLKDIDTADSYLY